ncbi:putative efflux pump antibiotic resistance protein [Phyllosticta citriasiana]|uniref:Efflux pump antibiotic resistance protein n=1 Tax=Phyllosticta citriasiana TaxID=595635 RepID=A0ABR1KQP0_9PEZI
MQSDQTDDRILDTDSKLEVERFELVSSSNVPMDGFEGGKVSMSTIVAVFFLGLSFTGPIGCGYTLVAGITHQIGTALSNSQDMVWVAGGWSIASATGFAVAGGLSDIFGRRWVIIYGNALSVIGAIVAATADKVNQVIAGSTLVGAGAGMVFVGYPGISEILPNKYRGIGLGWTEFCINIPWASFSVIIGQQLTSKYTWRWCYYVAIIYSAISLVGCAVFYFPPTRPRNDFDKSRWQEFKGLDFVGLFMFTGGLTILLVGFTELGKPSYNKSLVASTITVGAIMFIGCFGYEWTVCPKPLFPFHLFKMVRKFTMLLLVSFVAGFVWYSMAALLPQASLYMYTKDPVEIGVIAIPNGISLVVGGWVIPSLLQYIKRIRGQFIVGMFIQTLFTALYAAVIPNHKGAWMTFQFFGQGCFTWITTIAYIAAGLEVPQEDLGVASGLIGTFRSAGGSFGNSIFNTILNSVINKDLGGNIARAAISRGFPADRVEGLVPVVIQAESGVPGAPRMLARMDGITPAILAAIADAVKNTYAKAFRMVFYASIPFGVIALIGSFFIHDSSDKLTNHVAVQQEKEVLSGKVNDPKKRLSNMGQI